MLSCLSPHNVIPLLHLLYPHNVLPSYVHPPSDRTAESGLSHSATGFLPLEAISPNFCHLSRRQKQQHLVETFGTNLIPPEFSRARIFYWGEISLDLLLLPMNSKYIVHHVSEQYCTPSPPYQSSPLLGDFSNGSPWITSKAHSVPP